MQRLHGRTLNRWAAPCSERDGKLKRRVEAQIEHLDRLKRNLRAAAAVHGDLRQGPPIPGVAPVIEVKEAKPGIEQGAEEGLAILQAGIQPMVRPEAFRTERHR